VEGIEEAADVGIAGRLIGRGPEDDERAIARDVEPRGHVDDELRSLDPGLLLARPAGAEAQLASERRTTVRERSRTTTSGRSGVIGPPLPEELSARTA
jgi:hypothetical protein